MAGFDKDGIFERYLEGKLMVDWICKKRDRLKSELTIGYTLVLFTKRQCRKGEYEEGRC